MIPLHKLKLSRPKGIRYSQVVCALFLLIACAVFSACIRSENKQIEKEPDRTVESWKRKAPADNQSPMAIALLSQEDAIFSNIEARITNDLKDDVKAFVDAEIDRQFKKQYVRQSPFVVGINHRGWHHAPENTLVAYKESRSNGFDYVETDVRFTSDDIPVLLHDDTINRTARNADGTVIDKEIHIKQITYEQALTYDFGIYKGKTYSGTKIARFDEFILLCKRMNLHPFIELKIGSRQKIELLFETVKRYGMKGYVTWISFSAALLEHVKECDEGASLGYLIVAPITESHISTAKNLRTGHNYVFLNSSSNLAETDIRMCIEADIPLMVWTVNSAERILSLDPYVSGMTSDSLNAEDFFLKHNLP